jgi:hypothetical protein
MPTPEEGLEDLKHALAMKVELEKWKLRKEELEYLEAGQHLRSLNQILWQVPGMTIAITGGVWYGVTTVSTDGPKIYALLFVAAANLLTIPVIWRLRSLISKHIDVQNSFSARPQPQRRINYIVVLCWSLLLAIATALSTLGALNPDYLVKQEAATKTKVLLIEQPIGAPLIWCLTFRQTVVRVALIPPQNRTAYLTRSDDDALLG